MGTDLERVVTRSKIADDLKALGLRDGDVVMMHESVRNIGWIVGGPDVVIDAVCDVIGKEGTLFKLIGSEDGLYACPTMPEHARKAYEAECPGYDIDRTRGCREFGLLAEYLRTRRGAKRSSHPDGSFGAVGKLAEWMVADHPLVNGMGRGSPLEKLVEANGKVMHLGSPVDTTTLIHYAEYLVSLPNKRTYRYPAAVMRDGMRTIVDVEELDSDNGILPWSGEGDYFAAIVREFLALGDGSSSSGKVGYADSHLMNAKALVPFAIQWMERNLQQP